MWALGIIVIFFSFLIFFSTIAGYAGHTFKILEMNLAKLEQSNKVLINRNQSLTDISLDLLSISDLGRLEE
jgi:hypothetical protein